VSYHVGVARRVPPSRSVHAFEAGGKQYIRIAIAPATLPAKLSGAEREVVALLLAGKSNAEIAKARGVALRTVANQVASILRKLRVGSRSALLATLARSDGQ
jgi:DNA-binding CsgD family transcriptional regulator